MIAVCTWGDGPDVLLVVEPAGPAFMLLEPPAGFDRCLHGYCGHGVIELTAAAARALAAGLLAAAERAEELECGWRTAEEAAVRSSAGA